MAGSVRWYPWSDGQVEIDTMLIPPTSKWPDWHIRVHRIKINTNVRTLHTVEGGFAILGRCKSDGTNLPTVEQLEREIRVGTTECMVQDVESVLVASAAGLSGISIGAFKAGGPSRRCYALKPDSNTNLACQRTLIPVVAQDFAKPLVTGTEIIMVTKVFAISASANGGRDLPEDGAERWADPPLLSIAGVSEKKGAEYCIICP
jgi:hypothetical protein